MVPVLLLLPLLGLLLFDQIERAANSSLDEALEDIALTLAAQFDSRSDEPRIEISNPMDKALRFDSQDEILYVAVAPGQRPLLGDAALLRVQPAPEALAAGQHRQSNVQLEGRELRLVQLGTPCGPHTCQVLVAETLRKRHTCWPRSALTSSSSASAGPADGRCRVVGHPPGPAAGHRAQPGTGAARPASPAATGLGPARGADATAGRLQPLV